MTIFRNIENDITLKINGPEFVIIGDGDLVSDADLLALARDEEVDGWIQVEGSW